MAGSRPKEELYDLDTDPWEINNLADNPKFADVKAKLSKELTAWQERIDDKGRTPEDTSIHAQFEEQMKRAYEKRIRNRPADWFLSAPALGPYRLK